MVFESISLLALVGSGGWKPPSARSEAVKQTILVTIHGDGGLGLWPRSSNGVQLPTSHPLVPTV